MTKIDTTLWACIVSLSIIFLCDNVDGDSHVPPWSSPCIPDDKCIFNATYPCTWTKQKCEYGDGQPVFMCYDVPDTASFEYTLTPRTVLHLLIPNSQ